MRHIYTSRETDDAHYTTLTYNGAESSKNEVVRKGGAVVFIRDAESDKEQFLPIYHHHSITLRDLAEEFNISSVLECDAQGSVQPRTVALDSPSDILHAGRHYIAHCDAKSEAGASRVTFRGRIVVKEYELDHSTPNSACFDSGQDMCDKGGSGEKTGSQGLSQDTETHLLSSGNPNKENEVDRVSSRSVSRAASLGTTDVRKRARADDVDRTSKDRSILHHHDTDCTATVQVRCTSSSDSTGKGEQSILSECSQLEKEPHNWFLPFQADLHGDGVQVMIQLEDLKAICEQVDAQEAEFVRRREEAERIMEESRKKLLLLKELRWS
ncbi:unnamed protein product [Phytomonas sp. EM1]|nr:unnamed protein product [Phytomonas sp. EM1]|eukprot:CCW65363.1 unnamed protein product [Phytomonas sp. isolate EM1]